MSRRTLGIGLRTIHIVTIGLLLGGYAFGVEPARLTTSWWLAASTGVGLAGTESGCHLLWLQQLRGLMTLAKLALVLAMPLSGGAAPALLVVAAAIASIGAHMPGRYRYYSVVHRKVIADAAGPGVSALLDRRGED